MQLRARLYERMAPCTDPDCDCLLWGGRLNEQGYGFIYAEDRRVKVHRAIWELEVGPIPDGLTIDHVKAQGCRHRHCASVGHLEPVTQAENNRRSNGPFALNAAKTHCDSGHEFTEANTYWRNGRNCRACDRDRKRVRRAQKNRRPAA